LSNEAAMNLLSKQASNLDYEALMGEKTKARLSRQIKLIREQITHDDHVMMTYKLDLNNRGAGCNDAIYKKTIHERYSMKGRMDIMTDMFDRTMELADKMELSAGSIQTTGKALMANSQTLVDSVAGVFTGGVSTGALPLSGVWPILQTMIGQVRQINKDGDDLTELPMKMMRELIDERATRMEKTNTVITQVTPEQLVFLKDAWYGDLKECQSIKTALDAYQKLAYEWNSKKLQHDALVQEYADTEVACSKASLTRESLISDNIHGFNHISSQLMHAVYESYFIQKRQLVSIFKQMEAAMNREFCENEELELEDARAAQLDAYLAKLMARWQYSQSTQRQESVIYGNFDHGLGQGGQEVRAVSSVVFDRAGSHASEFNAYKDSGVFEASVGWTEVSLPEGGKNVRVVSAQAFLPEQLKFGSDPVQVWMQRDGNSECIGADGTLRSFAHAQHSYYTMYTAEQGADPTYLTAADSVAERPSAVGKWTLVTPQLNEASRDSITKIELRLVLSYTPCPSQECLDQSKALHSGTNSGTLSFLKSQMVAQTLFSRAGWGVGVVMVGTAVVVLTLIMAHSLLRGSRNSTLRSQEHEVPQDQCEQAVLARGRTLRRQLDVSPASSQ